MSKGEISWYIIALILGIVIIAVLGYWFFVLSGKGEREANQSRCQSKLFAYCNVWSLSNFDPSKDNPGENPGPWNDFAPECRYVDVPGAPDTPTSDYCKSLLARTP